MDKEAFNGLRNDINRWADRARRAQERLSQAGGRKFYYAVLGLNTNRDLYDFGEMIKLQKVIEPPGEIELARAIRDSFLFGAIGRYSHHIRFELAVDRDGIGPDDLCNHMAWCVISAIRIRTLAELLVPAVCDQSWSTISAFSDNSLHARLIEDVPMTRGLGEPISVQDQDFTWIDDNFLKLVKLMKHPQYQTAVEALTTYHQHQSFRVMAALLWAGIESLFQINAELRFRLSTMIALTLEPRGRKCRDLYVRVKKLYDVRSKAVHGAPLTDDVLVSHIREVRQLLSRLLCQITERGQVPIEDEFEAILFEDAAWITESEEPG